MTIAAISGPLAARPVSPPEPDGPLHAAARALEASFLSEMMKSAGLDRTPNAFGGGKGEDQFGDFLIRAQVEQMVDAGGVGLAEQIFNALTARNG